jgi:hypothetical protein
MLRFRIIEVDEPVLRYIAPAGECNEPVPPNAGALPDEVAAELSAAVIDPLGEPLCFQNTADAVDTIYPPLNTTASPAGVPATARLRCAHDSHDPHIFSPPR